MQVSLFSKKQKYIFSNLFSYRYTRNLIDKGNGKFNIIVLCWAESQGSSVHDHSNSHCFFKMLDGELTETKFAWPDENKESEMTETSKATYTKDQVSYINGNFGIKAL